MSVLKMEDLLQKLKQRKNPERAVWDRAYHKSQREHWGVSVPLCNQVARSLPKELSEAQLFSIAEALWKTDLFDPMMCAIKVLSLPRLRPSRALWNQVTAFLQKVDGWALEDGLAPVAHKCLLAEARCLDEIEPWTRHPNFWMRRAALVYTLPFAKPGRNPERMLGWAAIYASDPEWFIQKAIGWWLRVLGAHNPERVFAFLAEHGEKLKPVARREATRKLANICTLF